LEDLAKFLFEAGMLRRTPRSGFEFLGSGRESVAEHSFRTALIGYALARKVEGADADRVLRMCLFHDLHEARTGDLNYVNKKYVRSDEDAAAKDLARNLSFAQEYLELHRETARALTLDARLASDADQLDMILSLKENLDRGNDFARQWYPSVFERLHTDEARALAQAIWDGDSLRWWLEGDAGWWIHGGRGES